MPIFRRRSLLCFSQILHQVDCGELPLGPSKSEVYKAIGVLSPFKTHHREIDLLLSAWAMKFQSSDL